LALEFVSVASSAVII